MIIWIFTFLDLIVITAVSLAHFKMAFPTLILFLSAGYLIAKFFVFREILSGIDAVFGLYILLIAFFQVSTFLYYFMLAWFSYKIISTAMNL
tara:strand:- start:2021 stop:2296 length:276 start_codon:yes stop_codon:yes gene_type:complete